jgi:phage tail-like protein
VYDPTDPTNFIQRFTRAFDDILGPVFLVIDCLDAYLDPSVTPLDFLEWLADWMGVQLIETWPEARRRSHVAEAIAMHPLRGTVAGLRRNVALYAGVAPEMIEIIDSGGVAWGDDPSSPPPGSSPASVSVRILVEDASTIDLPHVESIVAAAKPAHARHTVEVGTE